MEVDENPWYVASLRFWGDPLPLDDIGPKLGVTPSKAARKGEPYGNHPLSGRYPTDCWRWDITTDSSVPFEQQLDRALSILELNAAYVRHLISQASVQGDFFLGYSCEQGGGRATFSPNLLERVSRLGLSIILDLYPPTGENDAIEQPPGLAS